jgi:hypothetical protein
MAHQIGHFTECAQVQALVKRFGEQALSQLSDVDKAALIIVLGGFVLSSTVGVVDRRHVKYEDDEFVDDDIEILTLEQSLDEFIPRRFNDTSESFDDLIGFLEGIDTNDANNIIHFLTQQN